MERPTGRGPLDPPLHFVSVRNHSGNSRLLTDDPAFMIELSASLVSERLARDSYDGLQYQESVQDLGGSALHAGTHRGRAQTMVVALNLRAGTRSSLVRRQTRAVLRSKLRWYPGRPS